MSKKDAPPERYYRLKDIGEFDLCRQLGLTPRQAERAIKRGTLIAYKPGLYVMVSESALRDWIESSKTTAK